MEAYKSIALIVAGVVIGLVVKEKVVDRILQQ